MLSTATDMVRWHHALSRDEVLPAQARKKLFAPRVPVPDSDESYGYGWSLAMVTRSLPDDVMVFWVSNRDGDWNLEDEAEALTRGIADRVPADSR